MQRALQLGMIPVGIAILYSGFTLASRYFENRSIGRQAEAKQQAPVPLPGDGVTGVKILQFYGSPPVIEHGGKSLLCYSLVNATSVRVEPPVEELKPAYNHCFQVSPKSDTKYTLTAEGPGGPVSAAFEVRVSGSAGPVAGGSAGGAPRITKFETGEPKQDGGRRIYSVCFDGENIREVSLDPPVVPTLHVGRGCLSVVPERTTTYTLTATGKDGRSTTRQLTIRVP